MRNLPVVFAPTTVFVLVGFATTAAATLTFAVRNRERLREPLWGLGGTSLVAGVVVPRQGRPYR